MCGIAGYVTTAPGTLPERVLRDMTDAIRHRGPDGEGYYRDTYAALGHRRLSIIDLSTGQQPLFNETRERLIIFNGEIFNHAEIRPALERAGHVYSSRSDTETILHAYEEFGGECVTKLRGMFAFAIWDAPARTLFCARDRLGIKPFYYFWDGRTFAFASEIKALLRHPAISPRLEESLLPDILASGYSSDERTLFAGIRRLPPGHRLTLTPNGLSISQYWDVPEPLREDRSDADWIAECRTRLEDAVRTRLMSDVPLGMFLSGGVDSSSIAALMKRMTPERVKSFSVGYREDAFSELGYARRTAEALGTDHHEVVVGMPEFFDALPHLIWHEDEPIVWPSSVSLHFVSMLAAREVKVVLTGEGADELFAGYNRYRFYLSNEGLMRGYAHVPPAVRAFVRTSIANSSLLSAGTRRKLQHTVLGHEPGLESFYLDNFYSAFTGREQEDLLLRPGEPPYRTYLRIWQGVSSRPPLERLLYADQKSYLVELLMKQDQMSMSASIESRVPFLDHLFVEFAARVPAHLKAHGSTGKYILKQAVADLIPGEVITRTKMGFPTPLRTWLMSRDAGRLLATIRDPNGLLAQYVERRALDALLDRHERGQVDATDRIWRLLNLQLWGQVFLSGRPLASTPLYDEDPVGQV